MHLRSSTGESALTLRATETSTPYPSVRFRVTLRNHGFAGVCDGAWVELDQLARFAAELRACEQKRDGAARLTAVSPAELSIVIERADVTGHFDLTYKVGSYGRTRRGPSFDSVSGVFDLDAEFFGEMAESAEAAVAWARADLEKEGRR